ncbi:MAG: glycosyltransferase family 4 protein, partial [Desulfatiglandales bacterium]
MSASILVELFYLGIVLFTSLGLSLLLTPLSIKLAMRYGFMDIPDKRKVHKEPVPRLGGLAIGMSLILTLILNVSLSRLIVSYIVGLLFILLFGMLDDKKGISPRLKYLLQLVPPAIFVFGSGTYLTSFGDLLGMGEIRLGALGPFLTLFCMAGVMNAINLSDGLDGLAAGKCLICAAYLFIFAYVSGHYLFAILLTAVFGALLGFLAFNTHPARLFMGDSGSLSLGFTMGVTTVGIVQASYGHPIKPISMAMVLALPIFDTLVVMGRRLLTGKSILSPDKTHFHHLLLRAGFSHPTS